ncbi:MAG: hypothetical protein AB1505_29375 [Candidatus Latescibacterota bacterium]
MGPMTFILLSAGLLCVPVTVKYCLAFRTRQLVDALRRQERKLQALEAQLEALEQESLVTGRALRQVEGLRRQAEARRGLAEERLRQCRQVVGPAVAA